MQQSWCPAWPWEESAPALFSFYRVFKSKKFLFNYVARYFTEYINRLNEQNYNSVDREYIIEKETSNIYVIEDLINESYPLLVRNEICIDSKDTYLQDINEQLEYIIEQNKLLVIDKL